MGIPIDEEDCPVCVEFKDGWIFTYGDLVTLLLCFFILLFSMCKYEIEKFKSVAESFKPLPAGTPFMEEGNDSMVEQISKNVKNFSALLNCSSYCPTQSRLKATPTTPH
jgi:chemotaxis protein MotB